MARLIPAPLIAVVCALAALPGALAALPATALGAKLIGGREQAAVARAFATSPAHRHDLIVSIRASTVSPSWVMVRSVPPSRFGSNPRLNSTFYNVSGRRPRPAPPPHAAAADMSKSLKIAVTYSGSGSETLNYQQTYHTICTGNGTYTDQQTAIVSPINWSVRFVVDLDSLQSATGGPQGSAIVPGVQFSHGSSRLDAKEVLTRTTLDSGCTSSPTTISCTSTYGLTRAGADADLSIDPSSGLEIRIPMRASQRGRCAQDDYTLGPTLWSGGASTAIVAPLGSLGLLGTRLPNNPYAPVRLSFPADSALAQQGFLVSPCQEITAVCSDKLALRGIVALHSVPTG
jgi:hypothetical protein